MKKILILTAMLIIIAGLIFAQEAERENETKDAGKQAIESFNAEISLGFPVHWTNGMHNNDFYPWIGAGISEPDKTVTANTVYGAGIIINFTEKTGLAINTDFFYSAKLSGFASPSSDSYSALGANVFIGPVFYIFNSGRFRVPLGIGVHLYYHSDETWIPMLNEIEAGYWIARNDLQLGLGVNLGMQFHFDNGIYFFTRTNVNLDIMRFHKLKGHFYYDTDYAYGEYPHMDFGANWSVTPVIGIGLKW